MIGKCFDAGLPAPEFRQDGGQFIQILWGGQYKSDNTLILMKITWIERQETFA